MTSSPLPAWRRLTLLAAWLAAWPASAQGTGGGPSPPLLAPLGGGEVLDLPPVAASIPSPAGFLGRSLGERFTRHHEIVAYLEALAEASERVVVEEYGRSYEGRPLLLAAVSSPQNIRRLDLLRRGNLRLTEPASLPPQASEALLESQPLVVWLAYGVHGNESSSSEAALATAYLLAAAEPAELLDKLIVLIDPCVNPDGRQRYVGAFETRRGAEPDPYRGASEHLEPWPGGRGNHYLLDLNRDWAWASQAETRQRLGAYRRWEPQVYVDFHEMSPESTYFFPPAAPPAHPEIPTHVLGWLETFGRQNAAAFDRHGWSYFVRETFDLFYPGYGDSYPALRGAVGMTYEVGGGGGAGSLVDLSDGRQLALGDRIARHLTTSLATARTAAANRRQLLADFSRSRDTANLPRRAGRSYLWDPAQPEGPALADLLELHGIAVSELATDTSLPSRPLTGGSPEPRRFAAGTYLASTAQPLGRLLRGLVEPDLPLPGPFIDEQRRRIERRLRPEFFDITAWSLPLAFHLEMWTSDAATPAARDRGPRTGGLEDDGAVGYLVPPQGLAGYRLAAALQRRAFLHRLTLEELSVAGRRYLSGSLYVPAAGNPEDLSHRLDDAARAAGAVVHGVMSSLSDDGPSLGSNAVVGVAPPRVALVRGPGVRATSAGFLWHLLDEQLGLAHSRLETTAMRRLDDFDVVVLPDGDYEEVLEGASGEALAAWVRRGGLVVAVGGAHDWLAEKELTSVERWRPDEAEDGGSTGTDDPRELLTPGAIFATELSPGHPLASGLRSPPPALVYGSRVLRATGDPRVDVLTVRLVEPRLAGFAWPEAVEQLRGALLVSFENAGSGRVVLFAQEPDFRLFWRGTAPLFLNAVLYGRSLPKL